MNRLVVLASAIVVFAVGCGVVGDSSVEPIDPPFGLGDTLATTTTIAETTTSGAETTSTPPPVQTDAVRLYFITSGQLTYVTTPIASPAELPRIVTALQAGPPEGVLGAGLRSAVPATADIRVTTDGSGIANVELPADFFTDIPVGDQRLVIAQIVLTLTDSRGIGQVVFNQAVPKPNGELTPAGQPLAYRDFQSLLTTIGTFASTTTTTVAAATTTIP